MLQLAEIFQKSEFNYQLRDCSTDYVPKGTSHLSVIDDVMKDS